MGSLIVPSIILYWYFSLQYLRIPAARHHGESGECTYFDDNEQRTIFVTLSVILPFFQIRLENNSDYVTISWIISIYYIR